MMKVFELLGYRNYSSESSSFIRFFDWRKKHNANDSSSFYWDGKADGSGWLTKKSNQGACGACWVFGPIAVFEGIINLYFNQHLDFNLSEQHLFSCSDNRQCDDGGWADVAIDYALEHGVKTKYCFPYFIDTLAHEYYCSDTCDISDTLVFAERKINVYYHEIDSIKAVLLKYGPVACGIAPLNHIAALVGYRTDWSDTVTIWIFKESRSNSYLEVKNSNNLINGAYAVDNPVTISDSDTSNHYHRVCYDEDNDGFYWWGIGGKPDTCPDCSDYSDCNDNDSTVGPCDEYYVPICNYQYDARQEHINSDTTWNDTLIIEQTIVVDSGACLTINSKIMFVEHSGIIVKPGAQLNLYNAHLTKVCHKQWKGIEVWGNRDTTQYFEGLQGKLVSDSNSILEYAKIAIIAGSPDIERDAPDPYVKAGGIIIAKNTSFYNNKIDIQFHPYKNMHPFYPKVELNNQSYFVRCIFKTDNDYDFYYSPDKHVFLVEVKGISFKACDFLGTAPGKVHYSAEMQKGYGIYSLGSSFDLDYLCDAASDPCPDTAQEKCIFENLGYGIYALEWMPSNLISIDRVNFSNNRSSVFISGANNLEINRCEFNLIPIGKNRIFDTISGIYLDNCTGYQIEENSFTSNYSPFVQDQNYIGLYIKNSGTANNEIYNNYFDHNYYATIVEGVNRGDTTGLCIKCNDYRYNMNDIFVVPDTSIRDLRFEQGIAEYQGSATDTTTTGPAGNTFTVFDRDPDTVNIKYFNYLNDTTEYFNYLHHNYNRDNPRIYPENVNDSTELIVFHFMNEEYTKEESCPFSFNQGGGIGSLKNMMASEQSQIESVETDIETNLDGGSTTSLLNEIQNSNSSQANTLRQQLISYSPYLSDTVVALSIERENVLPNPFIRDIMLANPHSSRKEKLVNKIDKRNNYNK